MKKILGIMLAIIVCILVTGCGHQEPYGIGSVEDDKFVDLGELGGGITKYNLVCDALNDIKDFKFDDNLFITNNGELYQLSFEQLYSNNTNCKKINYEGKFTKFLNNALIDENNKLYYIDFIDRTKINELELNSGLMTNLQLIQADKYQNLIYIKTNIDNADYLYLENNNLYSIKNDKAYLDLKDEKIIKVMDNTVITDKNFYVYTQTITNKNECQKYADIDCITKDGFILLDNEKITSQYDKINFIKYNDNNVVFILDINGNVYYGGFYGV